MTFDLTDCTFHGPALTEPFVKLELEKELTRRKLLPKNTGADGTRLKETWEFYRRKLRELAASGGQIRVRNHVIRPLLPLLGYSRFEDSDNIQTREDLEAGGTLLVTDDGQSRLRVWTTMFNEDLFAPSKRGRAYRFSHLRVAQRVLLASGERMGLLTNGVHLLLLISDPARPDSTVTIPLDAGWKRSRDVPDSFRFLLALAAPAGVQALPELVDKARLQQARVTKELRVQARQAVERFIQEILDHPDNRVWLESQADRNALARALWHEGLVTVYRLLFILKLEASDDLARSFSFASTSLWRNTFSPSMALAPYAHDVLERGLETGKLLESGLRALYRMFEQGLECTELVVKPLGGALFGRSASPLLSELTWGERSVAHLLDRLLWTPKKRGALTRERVHYGPLDVEDLGRVYEALLELEPGITSEPMCRLRRQKLEVVVPMAQGEKYRPASFSRDAERSAAADTDDDDENAVEEEPDDEAPARGKKTKVEWIEAIPPDRFYLRVGLGRKASGSYYTPHSFVRFLVQETLGPQVAERSPQDNPQPLDILKLKVLDPAMGSGHFLVEACRFLGEKLYEACRLCDEKALAAEVKAEMANKAERDKLLEEAQTWRQRVLDLPDPDDQVIRYLPSRSPERSESGLSENLAIALCRRLVATHCLYGVDKNPLAVELAKLALWLESHAEGMPLTFLDHRLVVGDSLTGPFWDKLIFQPGNPNEPVEGLFHQDLDVNLRKALHNAIRYVQRLEASVGATVADIREKETVKAELDRALLPFRVAAAAWSGGVMLGSQECDDFGYASLLKAIGETGDLPPRVESAGVRKMIARGLGLEDVPAECDALYEKIAAGACLPALPFDLMFPEVFYPSGVPHGRQGFHAVLGNPPWDAVQPASKEFFARFDLQVLAAPTKRERTETEEALLLQPKIWQAFDEYVGETTSAKRSAHVLFRHVNRAANGEPSAAVIDQWQLFAEKGLLLLHKSGFIGWVLPSSFHSNASAGALRRLYVIDTGLMSYLSFENKRELFEIHAQTKFSCLVLHHHADPKKTFPCAFFLHDDEFLFSDKSSALPMSAAILLQTGGQDLAFLELRTPLDSGVIADACRNSKPWICATKEMGMEFGVGLDMTKQSDLFLDISEAVGGVAEQSIQRLRERSLERGLLLLHEGKTFHQYTEAWGEAHIRYVVKLKGNVSPSQHHLSPARYYRLVLREVTNSENERTAIGAVIGSSLFGNTVIIEKNPESVANIDRSVFCGIANSFVFDWCARLRITRHLNKFVLDSLPVPNIDSGKAITAHAALRLTCNHAGYAPLWHEQLGDAWREPGKPPFTWPVLSGDDERWAVRAAIDAVVADAYGLSREQYEHVLSTFSHASYRHAPELCLACFDELKAIGLEAFTKKHDPYWDIPLNENLPQPVIELPMLTNEGTLFVDQSREVKKRGRRKRT